MNQLIFSPAYSQSGFTNASISASNDKEASVIIREILQNSYDSAIEEVGVETAKVKFIIDTIKKSEIPGIDDYENAIKSISSENLSGHEQEQDILNVIKDELDNDEIPVLYIVDNGIGFNQDKLVAVLSDGISDKNNPDSSGGSYGNGHFSAFSMSSLRYVLYGGKLNDGTKICSGQALLRTHKDANELKLGTGFLKTQDLAITKENDIFLKGDSVPHILAPKLDNITDSGAVVAILGFNSFDKEVSLSKTIDLISSSIVRNFFVAIYNHQLEVEISSSEYSTIINSNNLEKIFFDTQDESSKPSFNEAKRFYKIVMNGQVETVNTSEGEVDLYYMPSDTDTQLAICRNGMWINNSIPTPLNKAQFRMNKPFNALVLPKRNSSISTLIRRAEGNLHMDIKLNRFSMDRAGKEKKKRLQNSFTEIRDFFLKRIDKNNEDIISVDIPELAISMIGETKSMKPSKRKSPNTAKVPRMQKNIIGSEEDTSKKGKGKKEKSKTKVRVGNPFNVSSFNAIHDPVNKTARVRFETNKKASNLLLSLRLEDGTDPTCDMYGNSTDRLKIIRAIDSVNKEYEIISHDTINIGAMNPKDLQNISLEFETNVHGNYTIDYEFLNSTSQKESYEPAN